MPSLRFRLLALASALAAWALVAVGGVVRATESGLGCPDWPLCNGDAVPAAQKAPVIEYSHRATATVVTLLVLATAAWAWRRYRSRRDVLVSAWTAAVLVPVQAVLGAVVVWLELPRWIVAVHFVVGMIFLAATVVTVARAWTGTAAASVRAVWAAWASAAAGLALVAVGASVVAAHADDACGSEWPACNGGFARGGDLAALQVTHRMLAYLVAAFASTLAVLAWRRSAPRLLGTLPLAAVVVQIGIGIALVLAGESSAHGPLEALHVAGAGAVWAALVALAAQVGPPRVYPHAAPAVPSTALREGVRS